MVDKYRVQSDGRVFGPFTAERLVDLLVDGKVGEDALVCPQGETEWVPWSSVPALGGSAEHFAASEANPPVFSPGPPGPPSRANSPRVIKQRKKTAGVARLKSQTVAGGQDGGSNAGGKHTNMVVVIAVAIALLVGVGFGILFRTEKSNDPPIAESYGNVIANKTDGSKTAAKLPGPEFVRKSFPKAEPNIEPRPEPTNEPKAAQIAQRTNESETKPKPNPGFKLRDKPSRTPVVAAVAVVARRLKLKNAVTAGGAKQRLVIIPKGGVDVDSNADQPYLQQTANRLQAFGPISAWLSSESRRRTSRKLTIVGESESDERTELGHITIGEKSGQLELALNTKGSLFQITDALRLSCIVVSSQESVQAYVVDALNDKTGDQRFEQPEVRGAGATQAAWKNRKWISESDHKELAKLSEESGLLPYQLVPKYLSLGRTKTRVIRDGRVYRLQGTTFTLDVRPPDDAGRTKIEISPSQQTFQKSDVRASRELFRAVVKSDLRTMAVFGLPLLQDDGKNGSEERVKRFRALLRRLERCKEVYLDTKIIDVKTLRCTKEIKVVNGVVKNVSRKYQDSIIKFTSTLGTALKNVSSSGISEINNAAMGCEVFIQYEVRGQSYRVPYKVYKKTR